jgi:hypothetical protein
MSGRRERFHVDRAMRYLQIGDTERAARHVRRARELAFGGPATYELEDNLPRSAAGPLFSTDDALPLEHVFGASSKNGPASKYPLPALPTAGIVQPTSSYQAGWIRRNQGSHLIGDPHTDSSIPPFLR